MEDYIQIGAKFCVVPNDFDNAIFAKLFTFDKERITLECNRDIHFDEEEEIEVFANCKNGIFYCKSKILSCKNKFLQIQTPNEYDILQRRENERIMIKKEILVSDGNNQFTVKLIDLSVGGMKILTDKELKISGSYTVNLDFDNLNLNFEFKPLRISADEDKYEVSGIINSKNSSDKIELVQYCYKKQFEESNKK